jgi:hypothetical protein
MVPGVTPDSPQPQPRLTPDIEGLLDGLRGRIRRYVWWEGIAVAVGWLGLAFWVSLLLDQPWFWEPSVIIRAGVLAIVVGVLLFVLFWLVGRRALVPLRRRSMALLLERRYTRLGDSLVTAVELTDAGAPTAGYSPQMLAETCELARQGAADIDLARVLDYRPLWRSASAAGLLALSVAAFGLLAPQAFGVWSRRCLLLSSELWPRFTELSIDGFRDNRVKVARGADFELVVRANTAKRVPAVVQVRYRTDEGFRARENMVRDGVAQPGVDPFQRFSHRFQGVLTSISLDVVGGDDRHRDLRIEVVDSPTIAQMRLALEYPAYMRRPARELPASGAMQVPMGAKVTVRALANKPLVEVLVRSPASAADAVAGGAAIESAAGPAAITIPIASGVRQFELPLGAVLDDRTLLFTLRDADGIESREPVRLALGVVPDQPPEVAIELLGIGSAVTPIARIPVAGELTDDYGLADAWFEAAIGEDGVPLQLPLARRPEGRVKLAFDADEPEALDLRDQLPDGQGGKLRLAPGQKLTLSVKARDGCDLGDAPQQGASPRFQLDVVTPDALRALLESRELALRQRFETIIAEMTESSETLTALDVAPSAEAPPDAPAAAEPGDDDQAELAPESAAELVALRLERVAQNCGKNAQETLGVSRGFQGIHDELINNRVDTEELRSRLKEGIAEPLARIAGEMFPELDRRLQALEAALPNPPAADDARKAARDQADAILVQMRAVLNKMLELETFNEALAILRSIMESQEKLNLQTEEVRKRRALEALQGEE